MIGFRARSMSAPRWYGGAGSSRKRGCPPFRPRTFPHLTSALHTKARHVPQQPAMVVAEVQAAERIVGQEEVSVEVDPVGERGYGRRGGDRHRGLLHAA